ncbi:MAG: hypothetical protein CME71_00990 [Halobacteriovorax sp.]|nr:hypothetical protein [Halobacteriovorax sp.]
MTKLLILALILSTYNCMANIVELQEVRLAKAQIALAQDKDKEALSIISKNLDPNHFHRASYQFLIDYHLKEKNTSKALKVLYYMIGKLHDKRVLQARFNENFIPFIATLGTPSREAMEVYFSIAELYFQLYNRGEFSKEYEARLLSLSQKYFEFLQYYRFDLALTKIYLGKIHGERENYPDALEQFMQAKEIFKEEYAIEGEEGLEDVNLLIGTALLQGGRLDPGSIYLRSIYFNNEATASTKAIAQEYLNILTYSFISASASMSYGYTSNVYQLNEFQLSNFSTVEQFVGPRDGISSKLNGTIFYNAPGLTETVSGLFLATFSQESFSHELHQNRNERSLTAGSEFKYEGLQKYIPKVRFYYTYTSVPTANNDEFKKASSTNLLEFSLTRAIRSGSLVYSLPYSMTSYSGGTEENSLGFSVSYTPYWSNKLFSPSYSIAAFTREEAGIETNSTRYDLSLGVQSEWSSKLSTFSNLLFRLNNNDNTFLDFKEYEALFNTTYILPLGFSLSGDFSWRKRTATIGTELNVWTAFLGASFTY